MKNRDLELRTKREFYAEYTARLLELGAKQEEVDEAVTEAIRVAKSLLAGKCPTCGSPSIRYIDQNRQQGLSDVPGVWVMYRCSTRAPLGQRNPPGACDFMVDFKEGGEAN